MGLPTSGQISMDDIRIELGVPTQSPFDLDTARSGGYVTLNVNSPTLPPSTGQVSFSDWYGYCQTCDTYYFTGGGNTIDACVNNDPVLIISNTIPIGVGSILTYSNGAAVNNPYYYSDGNNWYYVELNVSEQTEVIEIGSCTTTSTTTTTTTAAVFSGDVWFGTSPSDGFNQACDLSSPNLYLYWSGAQLFYPGLVLYTDSGLLYTFANPSGYTYCSSDNSGGGYDEYTLSVATLGSFTGTTC